VPGKEVSGCDEASLFVLDESGFVTNAELASCCSCSVPDESDGAADAVSGEPRKHRSDCMVCGAPLRYSTIEAREKCAYCGRELPANAVCENGHFVCDECHRADAVEIIEAACLASTERDLIALFNSVRRHPAIPVHGVEHHGLVPGVILAAYRNSGGVATDDMTLSGIRRGAEMPGGSCAFLGSCAVVNGVAIAFSIILGADPLKPAERQSVQKVSLAVMRRIAAFRAARCCRRESLVALREAAALSARYLPVTLQADAPAECGQRAQNRECSGKACPFFAQTTVTADP
jgi:hypothetical protein